MYTKTCCTSNILYAYICIYTHTYSCYFKIKFKKKLERWMYQMWLLTLSKAKTKNKAYVCTFTPIFIFFCSLSPWSTHQPFVLYLQTFLSLAVSLLPSFPLSSWEVRSCSRWCARFPLFIFLRMKEKGELLLSPSLISSWEAVTVQTAHGMCWQRWNMGLRRCYF